MASVRISDVAIHPDWVERWKSVLGSYASAQRDPALADAGAYPEEEAAILPDGSLLIFIDQEDAVGEGPRLVVPPSGWMMETPGS
jgi:hypothetical protein